MENYIATSSRAKHIFNKICSAFSQYNITPTPINYLVWYEYYLNENMEFVNAINRALENDGKWHDILGFRLYHGFIKHQCTDMEDFEEDLNTAHADLHHTMTELNEHLDHHARLIQQGTTVEQLTTLKTSNARLSQAHQSTQTLLNVIGEKAQKTIDFNFRDPITKLYNKRKLEQQIEKMRLLGSLPPMIIMDLDHFSLLQQQYGALVAENIIRFVARSMQQRAGKKHCYRTGDNEFVIFTGEGEYKLLPLAEQIRQAVSNVPLKHKETGDNIDNLSITGILFYPGTQDLSDAMNMARKNLRLLKGRNQRNRIHEL